MKIIEQNVGRCLTRYAREDLQQQLKSLALNNGKVLIVSQFVNVPLGSDMKGEIEKEKIDGYFYKITTLPSGYIPNFDGKYVLLITGETDDSYTLEFLMATIDSSD
jgi:hypothetical protein